MRLLFAITVGCFFVLLWVALALARRIRLAQILQPRPVRRSSPTREFFEAGEFRTPRPLRLEQEILHQKPRRHLSEITFTAERPAAASIHPAVVAQRLSSPEPIPIRPPVAAYASLFGETVAITRIGSHLQPDAVSSGNDTAIANAAPVSPPVPFTLHRKPPQAARASGLRRRLDFSQYNNKDMGDLTDPYTHSLRGSGTQGPVSADRPNR